MSASVCLAQRLHIDKDTAAALWTGPWRPVVFTFSSVVSFIIAAFPALEEEKGTLEEKLWCKPVFITKTEYYQVFYWKFCLCLSLALSIGLS